MFNPKLVENFDEIDAHNIAMFKEYEVTNPDELRHICVVCGNLTCIEDSMSAEGHNLICSSCYPNTEDVVRWIYNFDGHEDLKE